MVADGWAVMEPSCRDLLPVTGQYCSHSKINKLGQRRIQDTRCPA
jgi:hypothetical protein